MQNQPLSPHWADQAAFRVIKTWGDRDSYTVASGITPSGTVHIGNFREAVTSDFVARALRSLGKHVRAIHSWDDFDTFRKVPVNLPNQELLHSHLRRPISRVPDAYGIYGSYAEKGCRDFEEELRSMGIFPEFIYQHTRYEAGVYAESIKTALERRHEIAAILNAYRATTLAEDWLPTAIFCEVCDKDEMHYERYEGGYAYAYHCKSCGNEAVTDIRTTRNLKLNWRTDWPMRWAYEQVDFEPGGKDHSSEGGSFDTASKIVKAIWDRNPPLYLPYDFVSIKGMGGKMSSSKGTLFTVSDALEVYEPQMVRWIFANQRPNTDFSLAFDIDVIKVYDEFDRAEQQALAPAPEPAGKWPILRRAYELSCIAEVPSTAPYRAPFRELCSRLQTLDGDVTKTLEKYYRDVIKTDADRAAFMSRAEKAWAWLNTHAPEEFRYRIHTQRVARDWSAEEKNILATVRRIVEAVDLETIEPKDLNQRLYDEVVHGIPCDGKLFFTTVYQALIGRDQGPRLPAFLKEIGKERLMALL